MFGGSIARSVREDVSKLTRAPAESYRDLRYTIRGLATGQVPPRAVARSLLSTAGALAMVAALLFPVYWIFVASITPDGGSLYSTDGFRLWPARPTLDAYRWVVGGISLPSYEITVGLLGYDVFVRTPGASMPVDCARLGGCSDFPMFLWNSLTVAVPTVLIGMSVIVPAAYALSRRRFIMRKQVLYGYVLFTQVGGGLGIAALIALYAMFVQVGLDDNKLALATYYAATAVPFNTWLLKTYMDNIPTSYEEAAIVDGASSWQVVYEVILPLSKAGLATVFIFTFLAGWMEFVVAQILLGTDNYTLPVGLYTLVGKYEIPWARFSAFALTFASPLAFVYLFVQRYIEEGLSFGGMEG